jgi:hypothetical protein
MMRTQKSKKTIIVLPVDFQEVLMMNEMKLEKEKEIQIDTIRNLIYLYSVNF